MDEFIYFFFPFIYLSKQSDKSIPSFVYYFSFSFFLFFPGGRLKLNRNQCTFRREEILSLHIALSSKKIHDQKHSRSQRSWHTAIIGTPPTSSLPTLTNIHCCSLCYNIIDYSPIFFLYTNFILLQSNDNKWFTS